MHPYAWPLDPHTFVLVPLGAMAYSLAVRRLGIELSRLQLGSFLASLALLLVAFNTPLETLALHYLLAAHLFQNVILAEWAPALLVFGLPSALAARIAELPGMRTLTNPFVALPLWLGTYFTWHVPVIYDTALRHQDSLLHLEHVTYFVAGTLMWWPVLHSSPRRVPSGLKAAYLFLAFVFASPLGLLLALLPKPIYSFYEAAPRIWGLDPLTDQQIAGMTMAVEQAIVFFAVFAYYFARFFGEEELRSAYADRARPRGRATARDQLGRSALERRR